MVGVVRKVVGKVEVGWELLDFGWGCWGWGLVGGVCGWGGVCVVVGVVGMMGVLGVVGWCGFGRGIVGG